MKRSKSSSGCQPSCRSVDHPEKIKDIEDHIFKTDETITKMAPAISSLIPLEVIISINYLVIYDGTQLSSKKDLLL